jgi:hypothetical protein
MLRSWTTAHDQHIKNSIACPAIRSYALVSACRTSSYLSPSKVPALYTDPTTCSASHDNPSPRQGASAGQGINSNSTAGKPSATPVPGWLEWLGELGIGLPLIQNYDLYSNEIHVCYWRLNWGRVLLQNVTISQQLFFRQPTIVPETGTLQEFASIRHPCL